MSYKADKLIKLCELHKEIILEYEIYNEANKVNRLEFRKGGRYLFEIFEEETDTLENLISDLKRVWHTALTQKLSIGVFNKLLLQMIGGKVVAASAENQIELHHKAIETKIGNLPKVSANRNSSWLIYKLKRNNTSSIVLFKQKRSASSVGINQNSKLEFNWIKIPSEKIDLLIASLEKISKQNAKE